MLSRFQSQESERESDFLRPGPEQKDTLPLVDENATEDATEVIRYMRVLHRVGGSVSSTSVDACVGSTLSGYVFSVSNSLNSSTFRSSVSRCVGDNVTSSGVSSTIRLTLSGGATGSANSHINWIYLIGHRSRGHPT